MERLELHRATGYFDEPQLRYPRSVVRPLSAGFVLSLGTLITHGFGLSLTPAMLPLIAAEIGSGYQALGLAVSTGFLGYTVGALLTSRLAGRIPVRSLLVGSYVGTTIGLVAAGSVDSAFELAPVVALLGLSASVSWTITIHIVNVTVVRGARSVVMSAASGGAALGVLVNGVLIQTATTLHTWRGSFAIAAAIGVVPIVGAILSFSDPIARPVAAVSPLSIAGFLKSPKGRIVILAGLVAGGTGLPFGTFLTATAIEQIGVGTFGTAALWWTIGVLGFAVSPIVGRYGDRRSPVHGLLAGSVAFGFGLAMLFTTWSYVGLLAAAVGYAVLNYPVWGLAGAVATTEFSARDSVRVVSLGLAAASISGAVTNAVVAVWVDSTGSMREPVGVFTVALLALSLFYLVVIRSGRDGGSRVA